MNLLSIVNTAVCRQCPTTSNAISVLKMTAAKPCRQNYRIFYKPVDSMRRSISSSICAYSSSYNTTGGGVSNNYDLKRNSSGNRTQGPCTTTLRDPVRQVFISQSNDIFTNLALEDWLYRHHDYDHKSLLLLWQNNPCVVIGRHQNPWTEANIPFIRGSNAQIARRNSGGGTVYHDLGNLNCTFFTRKSMYDRRRNLEVVCRAIQSISNVLNVRVNERDDIVATVAGSYDGSNERKISGTAAKLGPKAAYHHCTVLVDVNECVLHDALNSQAVGVETRSTQSMRVPVQNLKRADPSITINGLQEALGWQFLRTNVDGEDGGEEEIMRTRGFQLVRPDDQWFPGVEDIKKEFESHSWIFGKTPKFKVTQTFPVPEALLENELLHGVTSPKPLAAAPTTKIQIELEVKGGIVELIKIQQQPYVGFLRPELDTKLASCIQGLHFSPQLPDIVRNRIVNSGIFEDCSRDTQLFLADCISKMTKSVA